MQKPQAILFDLDGVLTDTSEYHYRAWKRLADEEGITLTREENDAHLRGVARRESLMYILSLGNRKYSEDQIQEMMDRKNTYYTEMIKGMTPADLVASSASDSQIDLSWTASSDDVGVTRYPLERCQGVGCADFAQIAAAVGTSYGDTGLLASTSYSYRVRATDAAGNVSPYSNVASATTLLF